MNKQEIFTKAYKGVAEQGRLCAIRINGLTTCVYRNSSGDRCAVGHVVKGLLPEEHPFWESDSDLQEVCRLAVISEEYRPLLRLIQTAHDKAPEGDLFLPAFKKHMETIASIEGLTV